MANTYDRIMKIVPSLSFDRLDRLFNLVEYLDEIEEVREPDWQRRQSAALIVSIGTELWTRFDTFTPIREVSFV